MMSDRFWQDEIKLKRLKRSGEIHILEDKKIQRGTIYVFHAVGRYKIGWTSRDLLSRLAEIQSGCPYRVRIVYELVNKTQQQERYIHSLLESSRVHGEWFTPADWNRKGDLERALAKVMSSDDVLVGHYEDFRTKIHNPVEWANNLDLDEDDYMPSRWLPCCRSCNLMPPASIDIEDQGWRFDVRMVRWICPACLYEEVNIESGRL